MDGTYAFVYSGAFGIGMGFFTIADAHLVGADCRGGRYDGVVTLNPSSGELTLSFEVFSPRGIASPAMGLPPSPGQRATITLPRGFGDGEPVVLQVPPGAAGGCVMVKRVPDSWAGYTRGFALSPERCDGAGAEWMTARQAGVLLH